MARGTFQFDVDDDGALVNSAGNVEALRRLWLDRTIISGESLGPGDPGDFDHGAWHVACHLTGAGAVLNHANGGLLWLEISHDPRLDRYYCSVTRRDGGSVRTVPLDSAEGREFVLNASLAGFVEGNSTGRTSARGATDSRDLFNLWRRQDFDQPTGSPEDGGKVWEHWCTLRDLRPSAAIATSVLTAYVSLVSAVGDLFVATVARGRREYGHSEQLCAMRKAGLVADASMLADLKPLALPDQQAALVSQAEPAKGLEAVEHLAWPRGTQYYMFPRKIGSFSRLEDVKRDLKKRPKKT
ncbi:MAG: hypothetical protein HZA54_18140 [Planctomycetes bacterium]|nr:hypothetical protein [Planctomycetota bacterium]